MSPGPGTPKRAPAAAHNRRWPIPAAQTTSTLPAGLFTPLVTQTANVFSPPAPVVVVDLSYSWTPLVFGKLFGTVTINRSAYVNPRYVPKLEYQAVTGDDGFGVVCPGNY